ncbi:MAG: hypothetical protein R3B70_05240 [Polyangiaceae bacterium]
MIRWFDADRIQSAAIRTDALAPIDKISEGAVTVLDPAAGQVFIDAVTAADVQGVTFAEEDWFDAECALATDAAGALQTSFSGWYQYENMTLSPAAGTWLVRGADGASVFKLQLLSYYANPDGSQGMAGGKYLVRVQPLAQ